MDRFYTGGFLHADDIHTLASNISTLEEQVALVQKFASDNFLNLIVGKYERSQLTGQQPQWNVALMVKRYLLGMLGNASAIYWWRQDLMSAWLCLV